MLVSFQAKAHCFEKVNGKLVDRFVIEPVASAALEALNIGAHACTLSAGKQLATFPAVTFPRRRRDAYTSHLTRPTSTPTPGMQTSFVTVYGATISDVYTCATDKLPVSAAPSAPAPASFCVCLPAS